LVCRCQRQTRAQPQCSDAAIQFCLSIKNLFDLGLRQTTGFLQSLLALSGLTWAVPDFSTLCRRQRNLDVQVAYRRSATCLHLLVDAIRAAIIYRLTELGHRTRRGLWHSHAWGWGGLA